MPRRSSAACRNQVPELGAAGSSAYLITYQAMRLHAPLRPTYCFEGRTPNRTVRISRRSHDGKPPIVDDPSPSDGKPVGRASCRGPSCVKNSMAEAFRPSSISRRLTYGAEPWRSTICPEQSAESRRPRPKRSLRLQRAFQENHRRQYTCLKTALYLHTTGHNGTVAENNLGLPTRTSP